MEWSGTEYNGIEYETDWTGMESMKWDKMESNWIKWSKESKIVACLDVHLQIWYESPLMDVLECQIWGLERLNKKCLKLFQSENRSQTEGSCVNTSDSITWRQANMWKNKYEPGRSQSKHKTNRAWLSGSHTHTHPQSDINSGISTDEFAWQHSN